MANININWDPPATVYIYQADLYCKPCGMAMVEQFNEALDKDDRNTLGWTNHPDLYEDSNSWPQEYSRGEGETDSPDHCGTPDCQRFLGRNLTEDGVAYVRQAALEDLDQHGGVGPIVQGWLDYYSIELDATDGYYGVDGICLASAVGIECEPENG